MAKEIEHKYLVSSGSYVEMATDAVDIAQGYLSRVPERTVRIRVAGERGFITVKGINMGDTRPEYEYEIPRSDAEEMLRMCEGRVIRKRRYYVDYDGLRWEVDRFDGDLAPLVVAEVELDRSRHDYRLPPFVGREVTDDPAYYNSTLQSEGIPTDVGA